MSMATTKPRKPFPATQTRALERGDPIFTIEQFERLEQHFLRRLAANANTDEVNGSSTLPELKSYFVCQYSIEDYQNDGK